MSDGMTQRHRGDTDPDSDAAIRLRSLSQEVQLLRDELSGLREMLEGVTAALRGAQKAYGAVAMRADLLEERVRRTLAGGLG